MLRKTLTIAGLALLPALGQAKTYNCILQKGTDAPRKIWQGRLQLKDDAAVDAVVIIIKKDGTALPIQDLKLEGGAAAVRTRLKPYDGFLVVSLHKEGKKLDLDLGHVESTNKSNAAPTDVMSWASLSTSEIGTRHSKNDLLVACSAE